MTNQKTSSEQWAEDHVGVTVEWRGAQYTIVAAGKRVLLESVDTGDRIPAPAATVMRTYVSDENGRLQ